MRGSQHSVRIPAKYPLAFVGIQNARKNNFRPAMNLDDKETQKLIVTLTKQKDIKGILGLLEDMSGDNPRHTVGTQAAKMAINLSANLILDAPDCSVSLTGYSTSVDRLLARFPSLRELDNITYTLVRLKVAQDMLQEAWESALSCKDSRLRTFSAILTECAKQGDLNLAYTILDELDTRGLVPGESDMAAVISALTKCDPTDWRERLTEIIERLIGYHECLETDSVFIALEHLFDIKAITFAKDQSIEIDRESDVCGICPVSKIRLQLLDLSDEEIEEMLELTRSLAKEATMLREGSNSVFDFDSVISEAMPTGKTPTVILDAANIAHTNQNFDGGFFRFDQIDDILNHFPSNDCLVVIHEKWLNPDRDLSLHYTKPDGDVIRKKKRKTALPQLGETLVEGRPVEFDENTVPIDSEETKREIIHPVPVEMLEKWNRNNQLLVVPHGQNDDWFWMHVCLQSMKRCKNTSDEIFLVSNDQMRDHFWRMKNPKFFEKFRTNHVCNFSIHYGDDKINHYTFKRPLKFSISIQKQKKESGEVVWHIPKKSCDGSPVSWFVFSLS